MKIEGVLLCPVCGGDYVHHGRIEIFNRDEDAEFSLHLVVEGLAVLVGTDLEGNPSPRRGGLGIELECEACGSRLVLSLTQHKGRTLVEFHKTQPDLRELLTNWLKHWPKHWLPPAGRRGPLGRGTQAAVPDFVGRHVGRRPSAPKVLAPCRFAAGYGGGTLRPGARR